MCCSVVCWIGHALGQFGCKVIDERGELRDRALKEVGCGADRARDWR